MGSRVSILRTARRRALHVVIPGLVGLATLVWGGLCALRRRRGLTLQP